jgi:hemerythrin-like domain-containing protein
MSDIQNLMTTDHRACDDEFAEIEQAVVAGRWEQAQAAMSAFSQAMSKHFDAEEELLFPAFEAATGSTMGPTQVMRMEHVQIRDLLAAMQGAMTAKDADEYAGQAETLLIMMQQHNMKEENILYPMCDQTLGADKTPLLAGLTQHISR